MAKGTSRAWFIVPAIAVLFMVWTLISGRSASGPQAQHAGKRTAVVTLGAPSGGGGDAAPRLIARLVAMGVDAVLLGAEERQIRLELRRVDDPMEVINAAITPEPITFYLVDESEQQGGQERDAAEGDGGPFLHPWLVANTRAELMTILASTSPPPDRIPLLECVPGPYRNAPQQCAAWLGRVAPGLSHRNVREVHLGSDRRTEEPLVTVHFDEAGARALAELEQREAGKMLAVAAFGELQARPRLQPRPDRRAEWTFSTRTGDTARPTAIDRAQRLSSAAGLPELPTLTIDKVQ